MRPTKPRDRESASKRVLLESVQRSTCAARQALVREQRPAVGEMGEDRIMGGL